MSSNLQIYILRLVQMRHLFIYLYMYKILYIFTSSCHIHNETVFHVLKLPLNELNLQGPIYT
jgi:hypothetical protein